MRVATTVWRVGPALVLTLDERLGPPVDSYVNGSQTWLVDAGASGDTLEFRLHPVAAYRLPRGLSHYDLWETVVAQLSLGNDGHGLALGDEQRGLDSLWDGLECFAAYGADLEPAVLAAAVTDLLGQPPDAAGLVDHDRIGDAWEHARGHVSITDLLLAELAT